jgi:hypothetical protein
MTPTEIFWLIEAKQPPKMYGKMTEDEVAELYDLAPPKRRKIEKKL